MKDLALTAEEAKSEYGECCPSSSGDDDDGPRYPWGLSICLDTGTLQKLGLGLIPVGTEVVLTAKATVTGTSSRERVKGKPSQDMDIQITAMDLVPTQAASTADERQAKAASKLYR